MGKERLDLEGRDAVEVIRLESGYDGEEWEHSLHIT
jgi:hypothetical protein